MKAIKILAVFALTLQSLEGHRFLYLFHKEGFSRVWEWECALVPGLDSQDYSHGATIEECLESAEAVKKAIEAEEESFSQQEKRMEHLPNFRKLEIRTEPTKLQGGQHGNNQQQQQ